MPFKLNSKMVIALVIYISWIFYYSTSNYLDRKNNLMDEFDRQLVNAAVTLPIILKQDFHKQEMNQESVTSSEDEENRNRLSQLAEAIKIKYIYSLIQKNNKILFTVSSATQEELRTKENISYYFSEYNDAPPQIKTAFDTNHIEFAEYTDKWGHFRSVFIPLQTKEGFQYLSCADIEISHIEAILRDALLKNIVQSFFFLLFIVPFIFAYNWQILFSNKSLQRAKEEIEVANDKLQEQRNILEMTVKERTEELEKINNKLKVLSNIDSLTNVANRRAYNERLGIEVEAAKRANSFLALLLIDIDFFKLYNDNYGHSEGDIILCQVAESIAQSLPRSIDFVARFGGEEFLVLLPHTDLKGAYSVAERIQSNIKSLGIVHKYAGDMNILTVSIGCTSLSGNDLNATDLFKQADTALYMAKKKGRHRIEVFDKKPIID
ncbi:MAG: diguanylate cyclase [Sulfurimonas sp.]|jgi:diguanylate cyclase (GGDEF)-like protein